jgi:putative isomerase
MIELTLTQVPFSAIGAWMSISPIRQTRHAPEDDSILYLRGHHGKTTTLMQLEPVLPKSGDLIPHAQITVTATPTLLRWSCGLHWIEACFDNTGLRFRGHGLGLRIEPIAQEYFAVAYQTHPDHVTINVLEARRQYRIERLAGNLEVSGLWHAETKKPVQLECLPDQNGTWEIALDEFESTWTSQHRDLFETCLERSRTSFAEWLKTTLAVPTEFEHTRTLAAYINWSSTVGECGLFERPAMLMSKNWMSSVWSWDHCFNALAAVQGSPEFAWDQMLLMADHQDAHGCYPDAINDVERIFNFAKPPVHGWTVRHLLERGTPPPRETLERMYTSLCAWTNWWLEHRRTPGDTLPYYLHGNDSGWDNSTMFDQGVPLIGPDLAAFLVLQLEAQSELANHLGLHDETERWQHQSAVLLEELFKLWREDRFVALLANGQEVRSSSLQYCLPILLGKRLPTQMQHGLVDRIRELLTAHGLATEAPSSENHESDGYWRGPIWAPSSYLIACGLAEIGETALAAQIARAFCNMCANSGFAENFDALTGAGLRDRAYSWTSSVFLLFGEWLELAD